MANDQVSQAVSYWSETLDMDPNLIWAVISVESGGNPSAIGWSGEIGVMQLIPSTAAYYGVTTEQLFDPYYNVKAGASYLKELIGRYGLEGGIQAYNLGETKYLKGITSPAYLAKVMQNYSPTVYASLITEEGIPMEEATMMAGMPSITWILLLGMGIGFLVYMMRR